MLCPITYLCSFFGSFVISASAWNYVPGLFAQTSLPLKDSVTLTIQRINSTSPETITLPFRSRFHENAFAFTDKASFWDKNCRSTSSTNGPSGNAQQDTNTAAARFVTQGFRNSTTRLIVNEMVDVNSAPSVPFPSSLRPPRNNYQAAYDTFAWILEDDKTGLFSNGNWRGGSEISLMIGLMNLVNELPRRNATRLIIDVLKGNTSTTSPQALLPTKFRAQPLAQKIVDNLISSGKDGWYRPTQWKDAQHRPFSASTNYLREGAEQKTINERADVFSQTIGQECQPFYYFDDLPEQPRWTGKIVIVSNGRSVSLS
ncbi:hypothetical protein PM082_012094 [Marasmius tenuissimus]|nr:hypothetical protein PM082_012094 [Marasmius tenuissimus]